MPEPKPALWKRAIASVLLAAVAVAAVPALAAVALVARAQTAVRRRSGRRPRLIWGPVPLLSINYWSEAMRRRGYDSITCVYGVSHLHGRDDFDVRFDSIRGSDRLTWLLRDYVAFAWALLHADIFIGFLEGSFLFLSRLKRLEGPLLRLAGKKLVVSPYGSDVAVPGHLGVMEERLLEDYSVFNEIGEGIRKRVDYVCRWADLVVGNYHQLGYLPRSDVLWYTQLAIDTDRWSPSPPPGGDGRDGPVTVVHAPNHRRVKGTDGLIDAVEALRSEGLDVKLDLIEGRPNEEVRQAMLAADVVVDQLVAGYAMFAIEGMSAGKPVITPLSWLPDDVLATPVLRACPLVDANLDTVTDELRRLVTDPALRREVGARSREFTERYHSLDAAGESWEVVFDHLWRGAALPSRLPSEQSQEGARQSPSPKS